MFYKKLKNELFDIDIIFPLGFFVKKHVRMFSVSTLEGEISILKNHVSLLTCLQPGLASFCHRTSSQKETIDHYFVAEGFLEIRQEKYQLLVEEAIHLDQMDRYQLEKRLNILNKIALKASHFKQQEALKKDQKILTVKLELIRRLTPS